MSQNNQKIVQRVAPGIYRLASGGFRVRVSVGDSKRGGQSRETTFPKNTLRRKMQGWQADTRATLRRQRIVPAMGTLEADVPRYLDALKRNVRLMTDRKSALQFWLDEFAARRRHTSLRDDVRQRIKHWQRDGVAASTIRHRLTALSMLYQELDGEDGYNPVKGVKRPPEPEPQPDSRPVEMIDTVLVEMFYRTAMNNRGWKTLARAQVLAHTGMRPSQVKRLDPDLDMVSRR